MFRFLLNKKSKFLLEARVLLLAEYKFLSFAGSR